MSLPRETLLRLRETLKRQRDEAVRVFDHDIAQLDAELRRLADGPARSKANAPSGSPSTAEKRTTLDATGSPAPRGREAVALVLQEAGEGVVVSDDDLLDRMMERGIGPDTSDDDRAAQMNAVRASANRLVRWKPERFERVRNSDVAGYRYIGEPVTLPGVSAANTEGV